jgi:pimeloyl-ACP methyl ester carboxylesterase
MKLIFLHGSGAYGGVWRYQTEYFPDSDAVNLPGHLQGQALNSVEEYVDWLREYVRGKGYKNVVLVGHSLGGAITLMYAMKYSQELKGIVIIGSGARLRVHPMYLTALEEAIKGGNLQEWYQQMVSGHRLTPEDYQREALEKRKDIGPAVMLNDFLCCDKFDIMDRVQEIKLPALIICGELDMMTPVKYANYLGTKLTNSRVVIIPQATHLVFAEKPEAVNEAIEDFVKGISC